MLTGGGSLRPVGGVVRRMPVARLVVPAVAALFAFVFLGIPALAQRPDTPGKGGLTRQQVEATFLGGVPAAEAIEANGSVHRLADLRVEAGNDIGPRAAMERFVLAVLQAELERKRAWLDDAAYGAAYDTYSERYDNTPFTVKVIATKFKGYPDLETFQRRWRVFESFRRTLPADALGEAALADEAKQSRDLLVGNGVEIEWWLHGAAVQDDGRLDFAAAEAAAATTLAKLRAGEKVIDPVIVHSHNGEASPVLYNPMQQLFGEGEYMALLREPAAAAVMRAKQGELVGPLRAPKGVLVVRVGKRTEVDRAIDLKNEATRELVRQLREHRLFLAFVDAVFAKAVLRLPRR